MSKEFQIRDGNLIASFDLENEDGDIDFCKLLKVSHGVADEIGMFVDYVATNKIIKDQSKQIANIEAKLAEKDRAIENWQTMYESVMQTCGNDAKEIERLNKQLAEKEKELESITESSRVVILSHIEFTENINKNKISFAVEQLEQLRIKIKKRQEDWNTGVDYEFTDLLPDYEIYEEIDNQIKAIKEMPN